MHKKIIWGKYEADQHVEGLQSVMAVNQAKKDLGKLMGGQF